ncbi:hypothetical protein K438DRAFT_77795 [Mycena galopus ATCC 62051]|nr:hypothetical protein K438DRAFT_77795 [Mycena galopus ATCC 62051]
MYRCPPSLSAEVTIFSEAQDTRRGFVGDFSDWTEESVGDALELTSARGTVTVQCEEDGAPLTWPLSWTHNMASLHLASNPDSSAFPPRTHFGHPLRRRQRTINRRSLPTQAPSGGSLPTGTASPMQSPDAGLPPAPMLNEAPGAPHPLHVPGIGLPPNLDGSLPQLPSGSPHPLHPPRGWFPGGFHRGGDFGGLESLGDLRGLSPDLGGLADLDRGLHGRNRDLNLNLYSRAPWYRTAMTLPAPPTLPHFHPHPYPHPHPDMFPGPHHPFFAGPHQWWNPGPSQSVDSTSAASTST